MEKTGALQCTFVLQPRCTLDKMADGLFINGLLLAIISFFDSMRCPSETS